MSTRVLLVAVGVALAAASAPAADVRWWRDPATQRDLSLSRAQVSAIDHIYESTLPERRALRARLDREDRALADAMTRGTLSDAEAQQLINRVERARIRRNMARTALLLRIYYILTPEQRRKLRLESRARREGVAGKSTVPVSPLLSSPPAISRPAMIDTAGRRR